MNKNKKIFLKIILILFACYSTTFIYIKYFKEFYNREPNNRWYYLNQLLNKNIDLSDSTIKYLFLGESRLNAGIDYLQIPNCWSLAYGGSSPIEQYFILKKYLENYPKPDTLFYSVSPRFLCETYAFWDYAVRNDFFTFNNFKEIKKNNNQFNDTVLGFCPKLNFLLYKTKYIGYYQADIYINSIYFGKKENIENITFMQNRKGQQFHPNLLDSCSELNHETKYQNFKPSLLLDHYFEQIFELCKEKNISVIFLFMPMNKSSFSQLSENFITDYQSYIKKYQHNYPNFDISDSIYFFSDNYFGDNSHLNFFGQQEFTNQLIEKYFK